MSNLVQRLLSAALIVPVLIYLFYKGGLPFILLIELAILLGMNEYYRLVEQKALMPKRLLGTAGALALGAAATTGRLDLMAMVLTAIVVLVLIDQLRSLDLSTAVTGSAVTIFGVVYVGWLLSHAILLRFPHPAAGEPDRGLFFIILAIAGTFLADAGAYFTGRSIGKTKLAPFISPGKTREGALGGIVGGTLGLMAAKLVFDWWVLPEGTGLGIHHCLILGPILVLATIAGDLFESMLKRDSGIKDSGNLIPGHGGILDRLDSILLAMPVTYYYLKLVVYGG